MVYLTNRSLTFKSDKYENRRYTFYYNRGFVHKNCYNCLSYDSDLNRTISINVDFSDGNKIFECYNKHGLIEASCDKYLEHIDKIFNKDRRLEE